MNINICAFILLSFITTNMALSWSEHGLLSRVALKTLPELENLKVTYVPLAKIIPKMGLYYDKEIAGPADPASVNAVPVRAESDLNLFLRIKKDSHAHVGFTYDPRLSETEGQSISGLEVVSHYADEPDGWKDTHYGDEPDTFLFDEDQYGDLLWKPQYALMGGREDGASQGFRHMWWSPWTVRHPIASFKLPLGQLRKGMGEADERTHIYVELSRRAKAAGSTYWQLRFLGNALHYLEDCTQAFHVAQTPTKKFIWMAGPAGGWAGAGFNLKNIPKRTTKVVAYYHYAYEMFIGRIFKTPANFGNAHSEFSRALSYTDKQFDGSAPEELLRKVAKISIARAPVAGKTALKFFPAIPKEQDLATFEPKSFMTPEWWNEVEERSKNDSKLKKKYFSSVKESFEIFGGSVRALVKYELGFKEK